LEKAKERITCAAEVQVETTLGGMLHAIHQMAQPIIVKEMTNDPPMTNVEGMTKAE
jgi:hypothetical protein